MLLRYPDQPSIGIDENAALVVSDGKVRAVSGDAAAGCVVKRVTNQEAVPMIQDFPFLEKHGWTSLDDLLSGSFTKGLHLN